MAHLSACSHVRVGEETLETDYHNEPPLSMVLKPKKCSSSSSLADSSSCCTYQLEPYTCCVTSATLNYLHENWLEENMQISGIVDDVAEEYLAKKAVS